MMSDHIGEVKVEWFASELVRRTEKIAEDAVSYGYAKGWLEDMDVTGIDPMTFPLRREHSTI